MSDGLWTVEHVATWLHCSPAYVYELVKRKQIPHGKIGRLVRFEQADVARWWDLRKKGRTLQA